MVNKPKVLLVDDELSNLEALRRTLQTDFDTTIEPDPAKALDLLCQTEFAAVVSDQKMPSMSGAEFLTKAARLRPLTTRLVLTAFTDSQTFLESINRAEIYRYITKPWDNAELVLALRQAVERYALLKHNEDLLIQLKRMNAELERKVAERTEQLSRANEKLSELALTDPLTRIANRRALFLRFQEEVHRAERYGRTIAVGMIDVDHFKSFNDMEGHLCGDEALKKTAAALSSNLRKTDFVGRYGGEEFIVILPEASRPIALELFTRLKGIVEGTVFQGRSKPAYLTVSIGIALFPKHGPGMQELIERADQALFLAKESGRNRIVVAD